MANQNQKNGLKDRLGAGHGKFGRNGSVWGWEFSWNDTGRGQRGYDNGFLTSNADIFERLKARFVYGVLENANYHLKANYFRLYLLDNQAKENDELMISLRFDAATENNVAYLVPNIDFSPFAVENFSKATIEYLKDVFANYALKLKGKYFPTEKSVLERIREANAIAAAATVATQKVHTPGPQKVQTLQELYADAVAKVIQDVALRQSFLLKVTPRLFGKKLAFIFPEHVSGDANTIQERYQNLLGAIAKHCGYATYDVGKVQTQSVEPEKVVHFTPPLGVGGLIPQADTVPGIKDLIPQLIEDKQARGGEPVSISKFAPQKSAYQKTPAEIEFLKKHTFLVVNGRIDEAKQLSKEFYK